MNRDRNVEREPTDEDYKWATNDWNKNRELHELLGLCWHEIEYYPLGDPTLQCDKCKEFIGSFDFNPDYAADPRLVLRKMTREQQLLFLRSLAICPDYFISTDKYILNTTGKLRAAAINWLKKEAAELNDQL